LCLSFVSEKAVEATVNAAYKTAKKKPRR